MTPSPMGYFYRFSPFSHPGYRLMRVHQTGGAWEHDFSVQAMTPEELRFVANVIDEAIAEVSG